MVVAAEEVAAAGRPVVVGWLLLPALLRFLELGVVVLLQRPPQTVVAVDILFHRFLGHRPVVGPQVGWIRHWEAAVLECRAFPHWQLHQLVVPDSLQLLARRVHQFLLQPPVLDHQSYHRPPRREFFCLYNFHYQLLH